MHFLDMEYTFLSKSFLDAFLHVLVMNMFYLDERKKKNK